MEHEIAEKKLWDRGLGLQEIWREVWQKQNSKTTGKEETCNSC